MFASSEYKALGDPEAPLPRAFDWACTNEHFWSVGTHFHVFQCDQWQDAKGQPCERTNAVRQPTYTVFSYDADRFPAYRFRVRMALWQIAFCPFLALCAVGVYLGVAKRRIQRGRQS